MPDSTSSLQEFLLVAHFQAPLQLSVVDLASWADVFRLEFPILQQVPPGQRVELAAQQQQIHLQMGGLVELPRIVLRSSATQQNVQLQADRICLGWSRSNPVGQPDRYPSYAVMLKKWRMVVEQFYIWHEGRIGGRPPIRLAEISYQNALPLIADGKRRRISELFRFVQASSRTLNAFTTIWGEGLTADPNGPRVLAQFGVGQTPPSQDTIFAFNFTGLGNIAGEAHGPDACGTFDALHAHILDMYRAAIIS